MRSTFRLTPASTARSEIPTRTLRHVAIFFSDLVDFSSWTQRLGDVEASRLANQFLTLQRIIITRDDAGQVLQTSGDSVFAVFDAPSAALNRALEIQRVLDQQSQVTSAPAIRIGLHMGEVLMEEDDRLEIISRHVNRARRVMEVAGPGQVLASEAVVEAAKDFIAIPAPFLALRYYGEYHLKGVGATQLCEVADLRFQKPQAPQLMEGRDDASLLASRLELAGYGSLHRVMDGPTGVIYRALQQQTSTEVAIEVFHPGLCDEREARESFLKEVALVDQLPSPGTGRLLEEQLSHRPPFIVREWVEGTPIDQALKGATTAQIAAVFRDLCAILEQVHAAGLVHENINPAHLLVLRDGRPTLLGLGQRRLQRQGNATAGRAGVGSGIPAYLAPETIQGNAATPATDLYALSGVLFKVLTDSEPFPAPSVHLILEAHLYEDPPLPASLNSAVADGLQRICLKGLEKRPVDRYPSAAAMRADLERLLRGELVRTRPTFYDNLLVHRVEKHVGEINRWFQSGLLTSEESHRLSAAYEGLQRRGVPALMEARFYRFWQTIVYLGGWAIVNGSLLWLVQQWTHLSQVGKLLLGSLPALTACGLSIAMWKLERFRLAFVALLVGVTAVPILAGVWVYEFGWAASVAADRLNLELLRTTPQSTDLTNLQLLIIAAVTLAVALVAMWRTATVTHSAQALGALFLFYTVTQFVFGLRLNLQHDPIAWAAVSARFLPLLVLVVVVAEGLLRNSNRAPQATPWIYFSAVLLVSIAYGLARYSLEEWLHVRPELFQPASWLFVSGAGAAIVGAGLFGRQHLRHRTRVATMFVIVTGLLFVLGGLTGAAWQDNWPAHWLAPRVFGQPIAAAHVALPLVSLVIALLACRYQLTPFLLVGLAGLAGSIHLLGELYLKQSARWPQLILFLGVVSFFTALFLELRRTRGNTLDNVIQRTRL